MPIQAATATDQYVEQSNVELNMMHFTPSTSPADGIHYVCRLGVDTVACFGVSEVHFCVDGVWFTSDFPGSNQVIPVGEGPTGSVTNYLFGNDPSKWRTGLVDCSVLKYRQIYSGIDLAYRVQDGYIKYEFIVEPNADTSVIAVRYPDADTLVVRDDRVTISEDGCEMEDTGLRAFQRGTGLDAVPCAFRAHDWRTVGFSVGDYDTSRELVIDPAIYMAYSTFLGGASDDFAYGMTVDSGCIYVTGPTQSSQFPTVNANDSTHNGGRDCFVTKFAADGQSLVFSTFLGGASNDYGAGIVVENGYVYVAGYTTSSGFPTVNANDSTYNGGVDCFISKLAIDGQSIVFSTFLGGASDDIMRDIAVESGCTYVTGYTGSTDFPTVNAYDSTYNGGTYDCFVTKFAADGQSLVYSAFLGGAFADAGYGIAVESGCAYVTGYTGPTAFPTVNAYDSTYNGGDDCFVTKFAADGQSLVYSTFLGGALADLGFDIAVESGCAYVTGYTASTDFPTVDACDSTYNGGTYDCFVTKFAADGRSLVYSTLLGGASNDFALGIAVESGYAHVTGYTASTGFPTVDAYDSTYNGGTYDCFVTKLAADGQYLVYSTFLGGALADTGSGIAVESGCAYVAGYTTSSGFPTANAYDSTHNGGSDCFVAVLCPDSDMDGLLDWDEARYGTDPFCIDSDSDNFLDGYEVAYGSNATDPMSYPAMPQAWYDSIYEDLDGNSTLIQNLISWSNGNATLLQTVMQQLDSDSALLQQVIAWLDGNHTAIETLFTYLEGNATLLMQTVDAVDANSDQLTLLAALVTQNTEVLTTLNATHIGDMAQIRAILDMLGVTVGDTDYDGLDDLDEIAIGTDIQCIDTDCDNLNDAYEVKIGTDPTDDDSDNDTFYDGAEVLAGTDPLDPLDYPGSTGTTTGPPLSIELIVIVGAVGCVGLVALLVIGRRRTGARSSS